MFMKYVSESTPMETQSASRDLEFEIKAPAVWQTVMVMNNSRRMALGRSLKIAQKLHS